MYKKFTDGCEHIQFRLNTSRPPTTTAAIPSRIVLPGEPLIIWSFESFDTNSSQLDTIGGGYGNLCDPNLDYNGVVNFIDIWLFHLFFLSVTGRSGIAP